VRNTVMAFWRKWHAKDALGSEFDLWEVGGDLDELGARILAQNQQLIDNSNPAQLPWDFTYPNEAIKAYFCLDKDTLLTLFKGDPSFFYINGVEPAQTLPPEQQYMRFVLTDSPRSAGWKDQSGVKRAPAPSDKPATGTFSGIAGLLAFVNNLPKYAAVLAAEGRKRESNIVLSVYNDIIAQRITVTEGLAILREQGL